MSILWRLTTFSDVLEILGKKISERTLSRWVSQARESHGFELISDRYFTRKLLKRLLEIRSQSGKRRGRPRTRPYPADLGGEEA